MQSLASYVGRNISKFRKLKGLTQEQLGEMVQQPQSYISGIERGEKNVSIETLERITKALQIDPADLFNMDARHKAHDEMDSIMDSIIHKLYKRNIQEVRAIAKLIDDVINVIDIKN